LLCGLLTQSLLSACRVCCLSCHGMARRVLPALEDVSWPVEPFKTKFMVGAVRCALRVTAVARRATQGCARARVVAPLRRSSRRRRQRHVLHGKHAPRAHSLAVSQTCTLTTVHAHTRRHDMTQHTHTHHTHTHTRQDALRNLEMPRFTRRYPAVLETLMKQMLAMVHVSAAPNLGRAWAGCPACCLAESRLRAHVEAGSAHTARSQQP
jgi:hypothetical protein